MTKNNETNSPPIARDDIKEIPLKKLVPRETNANSMNPNYLALLKRNISEQHGLTEMIVVCPHPDKEGYFEILDGHQRVRAYKALDFEEILCDIWDVKSEEDKIILELTLNDLSGQTSTGKRSKILAEAAAKLSEDHFLGRIPGAMLHKDKAKETTPTAAPPKKQSAVQSAVSAKTPNRTISQFAYPAQWDDRVQDMLAKASYLLEEDDYDNIPQVLDGKPVTPKSRQFLAIVQFTEKHLSLKEPKTEPKKKANNAKTPKKSNSSKSKKTKKRS